MPIRAALVAVAGGLLAIVTMRVAVVSSPAAGVLPNPPRHAPAAPPRAAGLALGDGAIPQVAPPDDGPGEADGVLPHGTTVFDVATPGVANLDPGLLAALRDAAADAAEDGVALQLESGWRSRAYQQRLFSEAVAKHGSDEEASRWVARPGTSHHELGAAVDIASGTARTWLAEHGAGYGLCRVYRNEPWHFELRRVTAEGCPATYADPTHDPSMGG